MACLASCVHEVADSVTAAVALDGPVVATVGSEAAAADLALLDLVVPVFWGITAEMATAVVAAAAAVS